MSDDSVISIQGVSKVYRIWDSSAARLISPLQERLAGLFPINSNPSRYFRGRAESRYKDFHALQDISFTVKRGESVGIIGRNGSGKSTLLQIIAGTLQPTTGKVKVKGKVAALLELGSGFNPEFTGRENIYLNGAVLGLNRKQVDECFDRIATFADIGDFLEQPVKIYSTGMLVRLAFAVQTAVDPEVLIVDEALSVGDEAFQRKCFARLEALRARGTSLLFVSHDIQTISRICDWAVLLETGQLVISDQPGLVTKLYQKLLYSENFGVEGIRNEHALIKQNSASLSFSPKSEAAERDRESARSYFDPELASHSQVSYQQNGAAINSPEILDPVGGRVNTLEAGQPYRFRYIASFSITAQKIVFACAIKTKDGLEISGMHSHPFPHSIEEVGSGSNIAVEFVFNCALNPGIYFFNAGIVTWNSDQPVYVHRLVDCLAFRVIPNSLQRSTAICQLVIDSKLTKLMPNE